MVKSYFQRNRFQFSWLWFLGQKAKKTITIIWLVKVRQKKKRKQKIRENKSVEVRRLVFFMKIRGGKRRKKKNIYCSVWLSQISMTAIYLSRQKGAVQTYLLCPSRWQQQRNESHRFRSYWKCHQGGYTNVTGVITSIVIEWIFLFLNEW